METTDPVQSRPRTSRQEAAELSNVIQQTTEVMEQRKEHQKRQVGIYCAEVWTECW